MQFVVKRNWNTFQPNSTPEHDGLLFEANDPEDAKRKLKDEYQLNPSDATLYRVVEFRA